VTEEQIDTINQVFALFRLNYHNQFYAAYPDSEQLNQVKKLWLESLRDFPSAQLLRGARRAIETSEYLPTLHRMLECCHDSLRELGLPDARSAYLEACDARSPKSAQPWSHPAVYFAGRHTDWYTLANEPESVTWPLFREAYHDCCARVLRGETLEIAAPAALPESPGEPSSTEDALTEISKLRKTLAG